MAVLAGLDQAAASPKNIESKLACSRKGFVREAWQETPASVTYCCDFRHKLFLEEWCDTDVTKCVACPNEALSPPC